MGGQGRQDLWADRTRRRIPPQLDRRSSDRQRLVGTAGINSTSRAGRCEPAQRQDKADIQRPGRILGNEDD